jgi:hypothetical protein
MNTASHQRGQGGQNLLREMSKQHEPKRERSLSGERISRFRLVHRRACAPTSYLANGSPPSREWFRPSYRDPRRRPIIGIDSPEVSVFAWNATT